jgi:hypothetical protein
MQSPVQSGLKGIFLFSQDPTVSVDKALLKLISFTDLFPKFGLFCHFPSVHLYFEMIYCCTGCPIPFVLVPFAILHEHIEQGGAVLVVLMMFL